MIEREKERQGERERKKGNTLPECARVILFLFPFDLVLFAPILKPQETRKITISFSIRCCCFLFWSVPHAIFQYITGDCTPICVYLRVSTKTFNIFCMDKGIN